MSRHNRRYMYKGHRVTAVVPAHNEALLIGKVARTMPELVDHIIIVDDCSQDGTAEAALASGDPRVILVRTPSNQGVGGAMVLGFRQAIELRSEIVVKMDGDGQMPAEYLPALLDAITDQGYDYAKGNSFLASEELAVMPRHRIFGNIVLTFMTKLASGYWHIFDPQNGYLAIKGDALKVLDLERIHKRYFFENDMLIHLNFFGFRVKDVGIPARYGEEKSGINLFRVGSTFPLLLLRRFFNRIYQKYILRDFSPIALFLCLGLMLLSWGMVFGTYVWIRSAILEQAAHTGTIMLVVLPLIVGFELVLQAIVLDIQETPR